MARKISLKRGAAIIASIAAFAALAGPGVASAAPKSPPVRPAPAASIGIGIIASWAEEASWAES